MNATMWPDFTPGWMSCGRKSAPSWRRYGAPVRWAPCRTSPSGTRSRHCTRTAWRSSTPSTTGSCSAASTWTPAEAQYIGRIGLTTDDLQRLMLDWRAPEAGHFYQATAFDRQGVRRRRHLILQGREVKAIEDDVLDADLLADNDSLQGEGALLAALNSKRTGRMSDIVGTIQSEQDRIIRSSISGALVVQGGPGTGKTAVALHRAAYLLYTHRDRLKTAGVLLVGPSSSFMKYIERVLPSLGETGVVMASVGRLMPGIHAVAEPEADVAADQGPAGHGRSRGERRGQPAAHSGRKPHPRSGRAQTRPDAPAGPPRQGPGPRHGQAAQRGPRLVRQDPAARTDRADDASSSKPAASATTPTAPTWPRTSAPPGRPHRPEPALDADDTGEALGELLSKPAILAACTPRSARPSVNCCSGPPMRRGPKRTCRCWTRPPNSSANSTRPPAGDGPAGTRPRPRPGQRQADAGQHGNRRRGRPGLRGGARGPDRSARPGSPPRSAPRLTAAGRSGTSWWTRPRSSRPCSGGCWCAAAR